MCTDAYDVNVTPNKRELMIHDETVIIQSFRVEKFLFAVEEKSYLRLV
jgi:DNA mismatch repair ATPase MutL